jgi:hypothetical protein
MVAPAVVARLRRPRCSSWRSDHGHAGYVLYDSVTRGDDSCSHTRTSARCARASLLTTATVASCASHMHGHSVGVSRCLMPKDLLDRRARAPSTRRCATAARCPRAGSSPTRCGQRLVVQADDASGSSSPWRSRSWPLSRSWRPSARSKGGLPGMDVKARFKLDVPFGERGLRWGHLEVIGGRTVAPSATSVVCPSPAHACTRFT